MSIKRIFIVISAIFAASAVFADNSSVTSKKYVDDLMSGYQGKLPGSGANTLMIYDDETGIGEKSIAATLGNSASAVSVPTVGAVKTGLDGKQDTITGTAGYVMTGTGYNGSVGEKPIYGTSSHYNSALVTAETVNSGVINAVNSSLIRVNATGDQDPNGTLWEIQDDLVALNICSNYTNATGTVVQNGTPTPTNPVMPVFYQQGDMILRRVGNYADSYDATTNKITRRVGVKVLVGTESWSADSAGNGGYMRFNAGMPDKEVSPAILSNMFVLKSSAVVDINETSALISGHTKNQYIYLSFPVNLLSGDLTTNTGRRAGFNSWLADQYAAGTPVVLYYPLATPVEESMPPRCQ